MNKENLLRMADYIETVPQEAFDMNSYRTGSRISPECNSVGCIIGHCTILDNPKNIPDYEGGGICFTRWSEQFTGLEKYSDEWNYLFDVPWVHTDNTPTGAAQRIRHFVENGLPKDWAKQMLGLSPLIYKA